MKKATYIVDSNCITPLGFDVDSNFNALLQQKSGIQKHLKVGNIENFYSSIIDNELLNQKFQSISNHGGFTKLEKMMILALEPIIKKNNVSSKSAFIFSTTKGNIEALENSKNPISAAMLSSLAKKIATYFDFQTEPVVLSNACVSGILAVSVAKRMIENELYDDAFVIAGDVVSEFVLSGFNSFQAMSDEPCQPYDFNRKGVNLGEATAAVYITGDKNKVAKDTFKIVGEGAINDANHISGPSRTGEGLFRSISSALKEGNIKSEQIDFISAHGTATLFNDEMEAIAFNRLDLQNVPLNSLKGYYGHTLGASGLLETVIAMESAKKNQLILSKGFNENGVSQNINIITQNSYKEINCFLKTASGFGGCNTAVLFEKVN